MNDCSFWWKQRDRNSAPVFLRRRRERIEKKESDWNVETGNKKRKKNSEYRIPNWVTNWIRKRRERRSNQLLLRPEKEQNRSVVRVLISIRSLKNSVQIKGRERVKVWKKETKKNYCSGRFREIREREEADFIGCGSSFLRDSCLHNISEKDGTVLLFCSTSGDLWPSERVSKQLLVKSVAFCLKAGGISVPLRSPLMRSETWANISCPFHLLFVMQLVLLWGKSCTGNVYSIRINHHLWCVWERSACCLKVW